MVETHLFVLAATVKIDDILQSEKRQWLDMSFALKQYIEQVGVQIIVAVVLDTILWTILKEEKK